MPFTLISCDKSVNHKTVIYPKKKLTLKNTSISRILLEECINLPFLLELNFFSKYHFEKFGPFLLLIGINLTLKLWSLDLQDLTH